ncbi:MAG TPA: hypothetical protein VFD46_05785, partial [Chryseolinea sp.]|nr:hypothetical protein [Chryseolinea sp.]
LSGLSKARDWTLENGNQIKSEAFWNPDVYLYALMPENYNPQISTRSSQLFLISIINPLGIKWVGNIHRSFIPLLIFIFIRT